MVLAEKGVTGGKIGLNVGEAVTLCDFLVPRHSIACQPSTVVVRGGGEGRG